MTKLFGETTMTREGTIRRTVSFSLSHSLTLSLSHSLTLSLLLLAGCGSKAPPEPFSIGLLAARSGVERETGLQADKGVQLAVAEANAQEDKVAGRPVLALSPDTQGDAEKAEHIAVRLATINNVAALIGGRDPAAAESLCRVAQQEKVPLISLHWLPPSMLGGYAFSIGMRPVEQGKALAQVAAKGAETPQVALLIDSRVPGSGTLADAFVASIGNKAVASREEYTSDTQLRSLARRALTTGARAILLAGKSSELEKLRTELHTPPLAATVPLFFGGDEDDVLLALTDRLDPDNEIYWTTAFLPDAALPQTEEFARKYKEHFNIAPSAAAAQAYDAARLLFEGIRDAKTVRGERARAALAKLKDFETLTGPVSFEKEPAAVRSVFVVHRVNKQIEKVELLRAP